LDDDQKCAFIYGIGINDKQILKKQATAGAGRWRYACER